MLLLMAITFAGAAAADHWIHIKVEDGDEERVTVNLPVSLLSAAAAMIPDEVQEEARIEIDELDMDWSDLMTFWQEVKNAPEATFVTVETKDETVKVRKEGQFVTVRTTERGDSGAEVDVTLPLAVIDGLLSGPEGTLNFQAALEALVAYGPGNLVSVRDGDETVRIWIDDRNETD
jgi:hypothetical protein